MRKSVCLGFAFSLTWLAFFGQAGADGFRAGSAAVDITPVKWPVIVNGGFLSVTAEKAHDPLHARAIVLDDGKTTLAMVVVDSCVLPHELVKEARQKINAATGIAADKVMISATHTHSAPSVMAVLGTEVDPHYPAFLVEKLVDTVSQAKAKLAPAKYGWAVVDAGQYTNCRQWIYRPDRMLTDPFGQQTVRVNMHPGYQNASTIAPAGPADPDLSILSFQSADGKPLAVLANFSMHYFGASAVSADYFGEFCDLMQKQIAPTDPNFVAIMSQGTSGDSHWMDYGKPQPNTTIDGYAKSLARLAQQAYGKIEYKTDATLAMAERDVTLRVREPDEQRLAWAKGVIDAMKGPQPTSQPEVYAREAFELKKNPTRDVKVSAIRIGELGIATMSNEVFAITGLKIKAQSPLAHTFNIELANGEDGYIPPAEFHPLGGYTTWPARSACLEVGAEAKIVEAVTGLLAEVAGKPLKIVAETDGAYAANVRASEPVAYARMSEMNPPAGTEAGVLCYLDGPQAEAFSGKGNINRAFHFAGGRASADVKDLGPTYSVEMWVWNGLPGEAREIAGYFFSRGDDADSDAAGDHLGIGGTHADAVTDRLVFFNGDKSKTVLNGYVKLEPKTWNHVVLIREGSKVAVYLNGNPEPDIVGEAESTVPSNTSKVFLGGRSDNKFNLEGKLDEVAIYNRALTVDEISARYKLTGFPVGKRPVELVNPLTPEETLKTFKVAEGYEVQLAAAEPLVTDPVAIAWGPDGKLWVAEMSDYPLGVDDKGKSGGKIRYLEDTDNDGNYDKSTIFMSGVNFPTGVMPWRDGVLITAAPEIFFAADRDGDGKAEVKEVLYVGFTEGNTQLRVNGLKWGLDGWVYLANGWASVDPVRSVKTLEQIDVKGRDMRIKPDDGLIQTESGNTEFGRDRDDYGNWFGCNNSYPVWHCVLSDPYTKRNPHVPPAQQIFMMTPGNPRVYPISKEQKRYHSFGHAGHYTSGCATTVYRDEWLYPRDGKTWHHFICEPMHNVVQHLVSKEDGATFTMTERPVGEEQMDFIASTDEWFRPVNLANGPDGAMYVVDMYRYMIEHPDWLPPEGKHEWKPYYRTGHDKGRIWRVVPKGQKARVIPRLDKLSGPELAAALDSPNGWQRDMVQQLIVWKKDASAIPKLEELASSSPNALARLHAICTLEGLGAATPGLIERAMTDAHPAVRRQAIRIAEASGKTTPALVDAAAKLVDDPDAKVRVQLAYSLGEWTTPTAGAALAQLAMKNASDGNISAAVMGSAVPHYAAIVDTLLSTKASVHSPVYRNLLNMALAMDNRDVLARLLEPIVTPSGDGKFAGEQIIGWASWLDLVTSRKGNVKHMAEKADDALTNRLNAGTALTDAARESLIDDAKPLEERAASARLLGRDPKELAGDLDLLTALLTPQTPPELQRAIVRSISRGAGDKTPEILTSHWKGLSPDVRGTAVDLLIAKEPWALALLAQVEAGKVSPGDIDVSRRKRLEKLESPKLMELAAKVLGEESNAARAKVVEAYEPAMKLTGDVQRGLRVYLTQCAVCHKYGDSQGHEIGPDLRSVRDWTPDSIIANVLDPNRKVEPKYLSYTATLNNGDVAFGIITAETGSSLTIQGLDGKQTTILRADVKSLEGSNRSLMPDGLEAQIKHQAMADLIKFLKEPPDNVK